MMKRVIQFAIVGAVASVAVVPAASAQVKIAYINSQKIMAQAPGRAEAEAEFDKERGSMQAQYQRMQDSMRVLMDAYKKDAPKLDSAGRAAREQVLGDRQEEFEGKARALDSALSKKQSDLARPLMEQVAKVLDEIRVKGGYSMIFDVAGGNVIVSADTTLDVTDQVLARLKELGPPKPSASTTSPAPAGPVRPSSGAPSRNR